ncbi:MAG: pilus assembly protein [Rhodospirillales bacterium]|jgi:Flp pilus assembly protein TadG|nr:pilus assembly protein [Rhodospirillales bacterium]
MMRRAAAGLRSPRPGGSRRALRAERRAVAAVEFALILPVLLLLFGGGADLGFTVWARGALAGAVSQGAYYAFLKGPSVQPSAVQTMVQSATSLSGVTATAAAPGTYCAAGDPVALTATPSTTKCADGTYPGTYMTISATYAMAPMLPAFTGLGTSRLKETVTVRLQ